MASLSFKIGHVYCYDCIKGLRSFIGKMKGVHSVNVINNESAVIEYDPPNLEFNEEKFIQIVRGCIDKLGFKIIEE